MHYIDMCAHLPLLFSNHAWVSFQGFAEAYNVALDVPYCLAIMHGYRSKDLLKHTMLHWMYLIV